MILEKFGSKTVQELQTLEDNDKAYCEKLFKSVTEPSKFGPQVEGANKAQVDHFKKNYRKAFLSA